MTTLPDATGALELADDDTLLRTYAPIVYLYPTEQHKPSSVPWMLARARLLNGNGTVMLDPVGSIAALASSGATADCYLALRSTDVRAGDGTAASVYGTVRTIRSMGKTTGYDLSYWYFYPFNGNIFALQSAIAMLSAVVVASSLTVFLFAPFTYATLAAASEALSYFAGVSGIAMHEGDWEHVTVRIDTKGVIQGVYCSAHSAGKWYLNALSPGSSSRDGYQLSGKRPIVYAAKESHANYAYTGTTRRYGGFADDHTGQGARWDPLDNATSAEPMGRLINTGHDVASPLNGQDWIAYPGRWGDRGSGGSVFISWFSADLPEYADGPTTPSQKSEWDDGDANGPTTWSSAADPLPLAPCGGTLAMAGYRDFLCLVYAQPGTAGNVACAIYNGLAWSQADVSGLSYLGGSAAIEMTQFNGGLHTFIRISDDLEWACLVIDDDGKTKGWAFQVFPTAIGSPRATGAIAAAVLGQTLYLLFERDQRFVFYAYDGQTWTDQTPLYPLFAGWVVDGPIAVEGYADTLYLAYGSGGALKFGTFDATKGTWSDATPASPARTVGASVSLVSFCGYVYMVYTEPSGTIRWSRTTSPDGWLLDAKGHDAIASSTCAKNGVVTAVFPAKGFLAGVFTTDKPTTGSLYLMDLASGESRSGG